MKTFTHIYGRLTVVQLDRREADSLQEFLYICSDAEVRGQESIVTPSAVAETAAGWESVHGQHPLGAEALALVHKLAGMDTDILHIHE